MEIDPNNNQNIAELNSSDSCPLGIDARKTHVFVIQKLLEIKERLKAIEGRLPKE